MPILLKDQAVQDLAGESRRLGLNLSNIVCWRLLERIDAHLDHQQHDSTDALALAMCAITQIPRPEWVQQLTRLKA